MTPRSVRPPRRRKPKSESKRFKRWLSILIVVVCFIFILVNRHGLVRLYQLRNEHERLEAEIQTLQEQAVELRQEMASLETDMAYIERLAREKYRMVKRGEKVFRVIKNKGHPGRSNAEQPPK